MMSAGPEHSSGKARLSNMQQDLSEQVMLPADLEDFSVNTLRTDTRPVFPLS